MKKYSKAKIQELIKKGYVQKNHPVDNKGRYFLTYAGCQLRAKANNDENLVTEIGNGDQIYENFCDYMTFCNGMQDFLLKKVTVDILYDESGFIQFIFQHKDKKRLKDVFQAARDAHQFPSEDELKFVIPGTDEEFYYSAHPGD
jgi:hypothetical protein